ncbi:MAG: hypothetical protein CMH54_12595 [Myxococcales bacterium]|nr:hypothetical protein [Myxococcales bacterium]
MAPDEKNDATQEDARRSPRTLINQEFESIESFVQTFVSDISRDGVFVRSDTPLSVGTIVNLRFSVIVDGIENIEGVGEVIRTVVAPESPTGMAIQFKELDDRNRAIIDRYLARRPRGSG